MISREELRQLASFECRDDSELAISFYFHPGVPQDKSHREEGILAKDLVGKTLRELRLHTRNPQAVDDLEKILRLAEGLRVRRPFLLAVRGICGKSSTCRRSPRRPSCL